MKWSILICTFKERQEFLNKLLECLHNQLKQVGREEFTTLLEVNGDHYFNSVIYKDVEIIICCDERNLSIGKKRNLLLQKASGEYVTAIDDDDLVSDFYISEILKGIETNADCCSLIGEITFDGANPKIFKHSTEYKSLYEENEVYFRP